MKSKKIIFKLIFDLCMFITFMLLYKKNIISLAFHEIAGLLVLAAMLIHVLINGNWVKAVTGRLFQKEFSAKQKVNWVVDFLELIAVIGMIITSLLVNKRTFPAIGNHNSVNPYHFFFAALLLILVGIHVGLHFSFIKNSICSTKKSGIISKIILAVCGIVSGGFGIYSLFTTSFLRWLKAPFTSTADMYMKMHGGGAPGAGGGRPPLPAFSFQNLLLLFAQMTCIALLFGIIAFCIQTILKKKDNKEKVLHLFNIHPIVLFPYETNNDVMIFILEDDDNIRKLIRYSLASQGFEVQDFAFPSAFWNTFEIQKPDLLRLDIMLPPELPTKLQEQDFL